MTLRLSMPRQRVVLAIGTAILASTLLTACQRDEDQDEPQPRPVKTMPVSFNPEDTFGSLVGEIQPRVETSFGFRQGGEIRERDVDVGDIVEVGTVIARL